MHHQKMSGMVGSPSVAFYRFGRGLFYGAKEGMVMSMLDSGRKRMTWQRVWVLLGCIIPKRLLLLLLLTPLLLLILRNIDMWMDQSTVCLERLNRHGVASHWVVTAFSVSLRHILVDGFASWFHRF